MSKQGEKNIQNAILRYLNYFVSECCAIEIYNGGIAVGARGSKVIYKKNSEYRRKGIPDIICFYKGRGFFIECKRPKSKGKAEGVISDEQKEVAKWLEHGGAKIYYARSIDDVKEILAGMDKYNIFMAEGVRIERT